MEFYNNESNPQGPKIVVIGPCNVDLMTYVSSLPQPGQTIPAENFVIAYGGRGGNQCVAASRLGAYTALIACVGDDEYGSQYIQVMRTEGVNTRYMKICKGTCTGTAFVTVAKDGENHVIYAMGANLKLTPGMIKEAQSFIREAAVIICHLDMNPRVIQEVLKITQQGRGKLIMCGVPSHECMESHILAYADIFCLNQAQAEQMTGIKVNSAGIEKKAARAARLLLEKGCNVVVLTLGAEGALITASENLVPIHINTEKVNAADTSGAGDAFVGALAFFEVHLPTLDMEQKVQRACAIATLTVERDGCQASFPLHSELAQALFEINPSII